MGNEEQFTEHQYTSGRMMGSCNVQIENEK